MWSEMNDVYDVMLLSRRLWELSFLNVGKFYFHLISFCLIFLYQPLYGFVSGGPLRFRRAIGHRDLFYIDDKDVDFKEVRKLMTIFVAFSAERYEAIPKFPTLFWLVGDWSSFTKSTTWYSSFMSLASYWRGTTCDPRKCSSWRLVSMCRHNINRHYNILHIKFWVVGKNNEESIF